MKYNKKNPSVDLRKRRPTLILLGSFAALSISLMAFEYKSYQPEVAGLGEYVEDVLESEIIPIAPTPPPPPPPPPPSVEVLIDIVPDDEDVPETEIELTQELDPDDEIAYIEPEPEPTAMVDIPLVIVSEMPEFPGGDKALFTYLGSETEYPRLALESGIEGVVFVTFVVEKDGSITDARVLRGIGGGCDEEAIRVITGMPNWKPGKQGNKKVRVQYNVPYKFVLN